MLIPQSSVRQLIEHYAPQPDTCIFHLGADGALLLDFTDNASQEDIERHQTEPAQLNVIPLGGLLYLCHAFEGGSWSDAPISYYSDEDAYNALLLLQPAKLEINHVLIDVRQEIALASRKEELNDSLTSRLLDTLRTQRELGLDELLKVEALGDPTEMLRTLSTPGMPEIQKITVDKEQRTTQILTKFNTARESNEPRARWILRHIEHLPNTDLRAYERRAARAASLGRKYPWKYCFFPTSEVMETETERTRQELASQLSNLGVPMSQRADYEDDLLRKMPQGYAHTQLTIMLNWRQSQGIYRFDSEILKSLLLTTLPLHLDPSTLTRLPEYCIYAETPGMSTLKREPLHGFFAMTQGIPLDDDPPEDRRIFILLDPGPESSLGPTDIITFSLNPPTLREALDTLSIIESDGTFTPSKQLISWIAPLVSQLLYLCSNEPEIESQSGPNKQPIHPSPTKTRKGFKIFPPTGVTTWACGWRTGAAIRKAKQERQEQDAQTASGNRKSPRGHVRRAHWHTYYAGPRTAPEREVRFHWLPMKRINLPEEAPQPAVIRKVTP